MTLYDLLLCLYPASFRAEYGREMRGIFVKRWQHGRGIGSRLLLLFETLVDVLRNAPHLHWDIVRQDVSVALRTIRGAPSFSITVILVVALGISATTAVFSIADHVLIKPLPFHDAERLVKIWQLPGGGGTLEASPAHFRDWQTQTSSFERVAAFSLYSANLIGAGEPLRLDGSWASGDLFTILGVSPLVGRTLTPADDQEASTATVVISERLWRARFGGDRRAIGTAISLNDRARVIVGVMPRTFEFPTRAIDFWIPFQFAPGDYVYSNPYLSTIARLKPGVSRTQAHTEIQKLADQTSRRINPEAARRSAKVIALRDEIAPQSRLLLWCLLAAASGLLLIACTNLANLLLTRGLARRKELAVRAALGAGRHRLLRQMVTEGVLLAGTGGAIGAISAVASVPTLARLVPTGLPISAAPPLDGRLLIAATIATLVSVIGVGLMPALRITRYAEASALREGARAGAARNTDRLRSMLVVAQVGASVVLLVTSGLLLRAVLHVQATYTGFTTNGVLTLRTALPLPKYERVLTRQQFFDRVLEDVRALPGVTAAAYITGLPLAMRGMVWSVSIPGMPQLPGEQRTVSLRFVTPQFFATMGIPIQMGRDIAESDSQTSPYVAVVSESFVNRYWRPGQHPIGRQLIGSGAVNERTIVGVVGDVRWRGLERDSEPQIYLSSRQVEDGRFTGHIPKELVVKTSVAPAPLVPAIRAIVQRADPQQPISDIQLLSDIVDAETAPRTVQVRVLGAFAGIAFLLAGIGLHGLLAYNVSQRSREIGVRVALGAERRTILAMVLKRGLHLAFLGIGVGTALALAAGRALQALLAGVSPTDVVTFSGAVGLAILMTMVGSLLPALQATRLDPLEVIRSE
jgi:putative ABC transport system permease protein